MFFSFLNCPLLRLLDPQGGNKRPSGKVAAPQLALLPPNRKINKKGFPLGSASCKDPSLRTNINLQDPLCGLPSQGNRPSHLDFKNLITPIQWSQDATYIPSLLDDLWLFPLNCKHRIDPSDLIQFGILARMGDRPTREWQLSRELSLKLQVALIFAIAQEPAIHEVSKRRRVNLIVVECVF
jgi:hypothetical protein